MLEKRFSSADVHSILFSFIIIIIIINNYKKENEMEWTSAEEKCFSNMKELVKSYCQSGQLIELYTQLLPCSVA